MAEPEEPTLVERSVHLVGDSLRPSTGATAAPTEERSRAATHGSGSGVSGTDATSLATTQAVRAEHSARARALLRLVVLVAGLTVIALQLPERRSPGLWLASALLFAGVVCSGVLILMARKRDLTENELFRLGLLLIVMVLAVLYHVGAFSPVIMALFVGIYFYGLGDSPTHGWAIFTVAAVGYVTIAVLSIAGVIDLGAGVFALKDVERVSMLAITVISTIFLGLTFWLARFSRAATLQAMAQLERAQRLIHQREALLNEARADLDKAIDAGRLGRFTGRDVGAWTAGEIVGRGAMGEVYAALHGETREPAALKLLHPWVVDEPQLLERFFREAEVSSALDSPHIVKVLGSGRAADGSPYIAMERLEGHDLAWHLRESRRLGPKATLELVTQVGQALTVAQDAGIVHRDLKPQNLFLVEKGAVKTWKVLDFGVSKVAHAESNLTRGAAIGTPSYMAPEQARGTDVDHRADVFSLGVITYRALTGRPAFTGEDGAITMYNVVHVQPVRPGELARLEPDVDLVIALALAKDPSRRFSSANSFAAALRDALRGELDERMRRDARELLEKHGWGADVLQLPGRDLRSSPRP